MQSATQQYSRSHDAVIRVYDQDGAVIETHESKGDFKEPWCDGSPGLLLRKCGTDKDAHREIEPRCDFLTVIPYRTLRMP